MFIDRRSKRDRRKPLDRREAPRLDLSYRRRRKGEDRRKSSRSLLEDFYAKNKEQVTPHSNSTH